MFHILAIVVLCLSTHAADLKFANHNLTKDAKNADAYIKEILTAHEHEFPGAIRSSSLYFYTDLTRLSGIQQALLLELPKRTDFNAEWNRKQFLWDIKVTATETTNATSVPVLDEAEWRWTKYAWKGNLERWTNSTDTRDTILSKLLVQTDKILKPSLFFNFLGNKPKAVATYIMAAAWLREKDPTTTATAMISALDDWEPGALDYLHDPHVFEPLLEKLEYGQGAAQLVEEARTDILRALYRTNRVVQIKAGDSLMLREVHPNIAIFRGYVGNDCSTSFSPGFVFTPFERYFYVFDAQGKSLGYVGLSKVKMLNKKAIFLHTIQGPEFTAEQTELTMRAIVQAAPQIFDTDLVVLGPNESISSNVNFVPIRETMMAAVTDKSPIKVKWLDKNYRAIIAQWDSTIDYDSPAKNHSGRKLEFTQPNATQVELATRPFVANFSAPMIEPGSLHSLCARLLSIR